MLDDAQLRTLEERLRYLRELEERRAAVLESIRTQGKLDDALEAQILAADSKARLEDIYLPYKPKRRTKAQIAREAGLEPLAEGLLADPSVEPRSAAAAFVDADKGVADPVAALDGARAILVERFAEDADLIGSLREQMWSRGRLASRVRDGQQEAGAKFADYFDFDEPYTRLPSHRVLAMFRGEKEGVLELAMEPEESTPETPPVGPEPLRGGDRRPVRDHRPGPARRPVAGRHGALGLAYPDPHPPRSRPADAALAGGRGGGRPGLRHQPARPAARRAGRQPDHDGPGPGAADRGEGGRHRRDRQGGRHRDDLSARAAPAVGRLDPHAGQAGPRAPGRPGGDRQRHRLPGDRQAGGRPDPAAPGAQPDQGDGVRGRRVGLLRLRVRVASARSQPRTVEAGRPSRPAITRCPAPAALASNPRPITSPASARRARHHAGNSTCVTPHPRHRDLRGTSSTSGPSSTRTSRATPFPHLASTPPHDGQASSPPANCRSTTHRSAFTVCTTPPSVNPAALPSPVPNEEAGGPHPYRRDHRAVAHEKGQPEGCPQTPSAPSATQPGPCILILSGREQQAAELAAAPAEALEHYQRALELWEQAPGAAADSPLDRVAVLHRAAEAADLAGRRELAVALGTRGLGQIDAAAEPLRAGVLLERLGRYHWRALDSSAAVAAIERAVATVPAEPPTRERAPYWPCPSHLASSPACCLTRPWRC